MYICDLVKFKISCDTCPVSQYGDCQFSSREAMILELEDIIMRAELAKDILKELSGE